MKHTIKPLILASAIAAAISAPAPSAAQSSDADENMVIEEVTVTARRRAESLSDVPGTVTAFTQQTLESAGVQRAQDFIALTPGVTLVDAAEVGDTQVNIRGINGARDAENSFAFIISVNWNNYNLNWCNFWWQNQTLIITMCHNHGTN